jgi:hypothetical protein
VICVQVGLRNADDLGTLSSSKLSEHRGIDRWIDNQGLSASHKEVRETSLANPAHLIEHSTVGKHCSCHAPGKAPRSHASFKGLCLVAPCAKQRCHALARLASTTDDYDQLVSG